MFDFLILHSNALWWKGHLSFVLVLEVLVGLHRMSSFSFCVISGWAIDLKDKNCKDLAEADEIKMRQQEYTKKHTK